MGELREYVVIPTGEDEGQRRKEVDDLRNRHAAEALGLP